MRAYAQGTLADAKNEILFSQFGINYNDLAEQFKKVGGGGSRLACGRSPALVLADRSKRCKPLQTSCLVH